MSLKVNLKIHNMTKMYIKAFVLNKIQRYQTQHTYLDAFCTFSILNKWIFLLLEKTLIAFPEDQSSF